MQFKPTKETRKLAKLIADMGLNKSELSFVLAFLNQEAVETAKSMVNSLDGHGRYSIGVHNLRKHLAQDRYLYGKVQDLYQAAGAPQPKPRRKKRAK